MTLPALVIALAQIGDTLLYAVLPLSEAVALRRERPYVLCMFETLQFAARGPARVPSRLDLAGLRAARRHTGGGTLIGANIRRRPDLAPAFFVSCWAR
jgi:hypothetical protein